MFSRSSFLLLSPLGTTPTLVFLGGSHGELKPLIAGIEFSRPKAIVRKLLLENASDRVLQVRWRGVKCQARDPDVLSAS